MEFIEAGKFLKQQRKARGFKTQKTFIAALKTIDPEISCSEPYISLIEKGVKTPSVHLLDIMAQVLELSAHEKGELLLTYKRVPSDFEFEVRKNLKESLKYNSLDQVRKRYQEHPNKENLNTLLRVLVLEDRSDEALKLLQDAPAFSGDFLDLQERTAHMAAFSGKYDFALQGYTMALENCPADAPKMRAALLLNLGTVHFARGMQNQYQDPLAALESYFAAQDYLQQSLNINPQDIFALDERARCAYHIADSLSYFLKNDLPLQPNKKSHPLLEAFLNLGKKKNNLPLQAVIQSEIQACFTQALADYQQILMIGESDDLPEKSLKEAVYFYAYTQAKLKLFSEARVLINSILILDKNWLTYFIKAGVALMNYDAEPQDTFLAEALDALERALDFDEDTVRELLRSEKDRELKTLWEKRPQALKKLLEQRKKK